MLFNFVLVWLYNFFDLSVTDESYIKFSSGIYDKFIYNHWVDATAGGDLFPRGYHKPSSRHCLCCADMNYHWYCYIYKLTVYKILNFLKY